VFAGHAPALLADDPTYRTFAQRAADPDATPLPSDRAPRVLLGRAVDVAGSTASFPLDAAPGSHVAVIGPDPTGADLLAAAVLSLAVQHAPGTVEFRFTTPVADAASAAAEAMAALHASGHRTAEAAADKPTANEPTYVVAFGADGIDLRTVLRDGPERGTHVLGWWRSPRRFAEEAGDDVGCLLFTNVPAPDVSLLLGQPVDWQPRPNRALLHDRHAGRTVVIVPFGQSR